MRISKLLGGGYDRSMFATGALASAVFIHFWGSARIAEVTQGKTGASTGTVKSSCYSCNYQRASVISREKGEGDIQLGVLPLGPPLGDAFTSTT